MVLKKFRITHSMLVEHYQYIEAHLEAIYAAASDEPFWNALEEIEKDSLGTVVRELQLLDKQKGLGLFTSDEYTALRNLTSRRNYWCHFCYCDLAFNLKTGGPAHKADIDNMLADLKAAEAWRAKIFQKNLEVLEQTKPFTPEQTPVPEPTPEETTEETTEEVVESPSEEPSEKLTV